MTDSSRQAVPGGNKPRLVRQSAFQDESQEPTSPRLNVRFLPTIPSAPDSSVQLEDEPEEQIIINENQDSESLDQSAITMAIDSTKLSSPKINHKPP